MIKETTSDKENNKFKSRTFWLTIIWTAFVPLSFVAQAIVKEIQLPLGDIVMYSGLLTIAYTGGNKAINWIKESKAKV